jgi:hypothetical protein
MASIGDKSFTTQMVSAIETVVGQSIGNDAGTNRFTAEVTAVDSVNSTVSVLLPGASAAASGFTVNGIQMPVIGDYVIVYINESERWVDNVYRTATSSPYLSVTSGSLNAYGANNFGAPTGAVMGWLTATAPTGWLFCDGTSYAYNTYPALGALLGGSAGGNFTTPDMRDRFLGSLGTVGAWSNTSGTIGPNSTITNDRAHTHSTSHDHTFSGSFSGSGHTHGATGLNPTATTIGLLSSTQAGLHSHTAPIVTESSGSPSSVVNRVTTTSTSATASSTHTHSFSAGAWTTTTATSHDHDVTVPSHDHGINGDTASATAGGTVSGTVGTDTTATGAATYGGSAISPKATRLNFIIKT